MVAWFGTRVDDMILEHGHVGVNVSNQSGSLQLNNEQLEVRYSQAIRSFGFHKYLGPYILSQFGEWKMISNYIMKSVIERIAENVIHEPDILGYGPQTAMEKALSEQFKKKLRPDVKENVGSVTARNSSGINYGATAVMLLSGENALDLGLIVIYKVYGYVNVEQLLDNKVFSVALALALLTLLDIVLVCRFDV
ncbi:protein AAR2 [Tanacetum coccineum]